MHTQGAFIPHFNVFFENHINWEVCMGKIQARFSGSFYADCSSVRRWNGLISDSNSKELV